MIREALVSPDANLSAAIRVLKLGVASLSEEPETEQSSFVSSGLHDAKVDVLRLIEDFQQDDRVIAAGVEDEPRVGRLLRDKLNNLIQHSEKWLTRY